MTANQHDRPPVTCEHAQYDAFLAYSYDGETRWCVDCGALRRDGKWELPAAWIAALPPRSKP